MQDGALGFAIRWERPFGVYKYFSGEITPHDIRSANETITNDAGFDDLRYIIGDFLGANGHRFDLEDRGALEIPYATLIGASYSNPHIHCAYVVTHPEVERLIQRKITHGVLPYPARIFALEHDARTWLGSVSGRFRRPPGLE
jgi:hypothetical protein